VPGCPHAVLVTVAVGGGTSGHLSGSLPTPPGAAFAVLVDSATSAYVLAIVLA
jgi:hypothetical protein